MNGRNQELGIRLHRQSGEASDVGGLLADGHGLHESGCGVNDGASQQFRLSLVADVRAKAGKLLESDVVDFIVHNHGLLGGADGSVVEGLGGDDIHHRHVQVRAFFQIDRGVARPHAQRGLAGAISCSYGTRTASGIDQADVFMPHQVGVVLQGVRFQAGEDAFGRAMLHRRVVHDPHGLRTTAPGSRMRTENHGVARLDRHDALEEDRRGGIGDRREREDDADGLRYLHDAAFRKLANDADGALVLDVVVNELGGHHVLEGLVFQNANPGFFDGEAGEVLRMFQSGQDHGLDDAVHVVLCVLRERSSGGPSLADQFLQVGNPSFTEG